MLALLLVTALVPAPVHIRGVSAAPVLRGRELDDLIARLPHAGCGRWPDAEAAPGTPEADLASMQASVALGTLTDAQWQQALLRTGAIASHERWPADIPYAISLRLPEWVGLARITLTPDVAGWKSAEVGALRHGWCGTCNAEEDRAGLYQVVGTLPEGLREVGFDVRIERGLKWNEERSSPVPTLLWLGRVRLPVEQVATIDEALPPVHGASFGAAIAKALGVGVRTWWSGEQKRETVYLVLDPDPARLPELVRVGLSLQVDVLRDGRLVEAKTLLGRDIDPVLASAARSEAYEGCACWTNLAGIPTSVQADALERAHYSVRVSGTAGNVLSLWNANRRWSGEITIPLDELIQRERDRVAREQESADVSNPGRR